MDGLVNWEATSVDGDRFNQNNKTGGNQKKKVKCLKNI